MVREYQAKPSFAPKGKSFSKLFFGIELEVEIKSGNREIISEEVTNCLGDFVITKHDSTVPLGFEICSSPASLEYHNSAWDKFFGEDKDFPPVKLLKGYKSPHCGMHVHISRAPLSSLQIGKMLVFIYNPENYKFISRISQRDSCYQNNFMEYRTLKDAKPERLNPDRHTAVNLRNPGTVEIRLFKANLKRECFLKNIEFCHAITKFTWPGKIAIDRCKNWKDFVLFVKENKDTYPNLYGFLVHYKYLSKKLNTNEEIDEINKEILDINNDLLKEKAKKAFEDEFKWKIHSNKLEYYKKLRKKYSISEAQKLRKKVREDDLNDLWDKYKISDDNIWKKYNDIR